MKWVNIYLACQSHGTLHQSVELFRGTTLLSKRDVELVNPVHRDMVCEIFLGQARFAQEIPLPQEVNIPHLVQVKEGGMKQSVRGCGMFGFRKNRFETVLLQAFKLSLSHDFCSTSHQLCTSSIETELARSFEQKRRPDGFVAPFPSIFRAR